MIDDLRSYALVKNKAHVCLPDCDVRISLSGPTAKHKTINISWYHPGITRYDYVRLMPCKGRLYIEPTNSNDGSTTYAITHKGVSNSTKVGANYFDTLKKYAGSHNATLLIRGDNTFYYVEAQNVDR